MKHSATALSLLLAAVLALPSCTSMYRDESQDITFETPGVAGAKCTIRRPGYIQFAYPPQTLRITKMREPLDVTCDAPGNRRKTVSVGSRIPPTYLMNMSNLYLGTVVDYQSGAMFTYPDKIAVDFSDVPAMAMPYPEYEIRDQYARDLVGMEEWRPGVPALMSDRGRASHELQPRIMDETSSEFSDETESATMLAPGDGFAEDLLSSPLSTAGSFGSANPAASRKSAPASSAPAAPSSPPGAVIPPPPPAFIQ